MTAIPSGTITFLFTDIEGSTQLWERQHARMQAAFARQEAILRQAAATYGGYAYKMIGDAFQIAFDTAPAALCAALEAQRLLQAEPWGETPIRVRMALHTGVTEERGDDYVGPALNRVARLMSAGHGGQVLITQVTYELLWDDLPAEVSLRDLGEHRFKDLVRPEHVYQLVSPGLLSDFPPLKSLDALPNNLPIQLTSFIGREMEMVGIKLLITVDRARMVTLTGPGGTGKTRLALQVAADLLDTFRDGVWLVELAPLADPALVPQTVAAVLGAREVPGKSISMVLSEHLRSKQLMLILDNCEHVVEACARLAGVLLQACPDLHILATSREILGAGGEAPFRVPSLSTPDIRHMPSFDDLTQSEAVRLFVERAAQASPDFSLVPANAPVIARICSRLDGIPLAIELAAARVRLLSVDQIAARLDDSFRLLTGGSRTVLPRHQTLKALIDWSYNLLSEAERRLFLQLSVFAGGWTLEAAETVCEGSEVFELMSQLVDKSLVLASHGEGPGCGSKRETRYRLLETIRQYAHDRLLEAGGGEAVRGRHLDFYLSLARQAEPHLRGKDQVVWLDHLEEELDNLRLAHEWSLTTNLSAGLQMGALLLWFWHIRGHGSEGIARLQGLLDAEANRRGSQQIEPAMRLDRAYALDAAGFLLAMQNKYDESTALLQESLDSFRELGQAGRRGAAMALLHLASIINDQELALTWNEESLAVFREIGDKFNMAECLQGLAGLRMFEGGFTDGIAAIEEDLALRRELGDQDGMGTAFNIYGILMVDQGDYRRAQQLYEQALACYSAVNNIRYISQVTFNLARLAWVQGDYDQATRRCDEIMAMGQEQRSRNLTANAISFLGLLDWSKGNFDLAERRAKESLLVGQELDDFSLIISSHYILAKIALSKGDFPQVTGHIQEVLRLERISGNDLVGINYILVILAGLARGLGQLERAIRLMAAAEHICWWAVNTISPADRSEREIIVAALRKEVSMAAFQAAWAEGQAMTLEQTLAYAQESFKNE